MECRGKYAQDNFDRLQRWRKDYNAATKTDRQKRQLLRRQEASEYVNSIKVGPCVDCDRTFPPVAMDFDHVRGPKTKGVAQMVSQAYKLDLIKSEIAKCDLVCACCHRVRTSKRGENAAPQR